MGADLIMASYWIHEGDKPDWDAAEAHAKKVKWGKDGCEFPENARESLIEDYVIHGQEDGDITTDEQADKLIQEKLAEYLALFRRAVEGDNREMTYIGYAGWRVYVTGGMSWGDSPTDLLEPAGNLDQTGVLDAAGFFPKPEPPETVSVLIFSGRHGTDVIGCYQTEQAARAALAGLCRELWDREVCEPGGKSVEIPDSDDAAICGYFELVENNWSEITEHKITS